MNKTRFEFLKKNISLDDRETRSTRYETDRFAGARKLHEMFNENNLKARNPSIFNCLDECLFSCR